MKRYLAALLCACVLCAGCGTAPVAEPPEVTASPKAVLFVAPSPTPTPAERAEALEASFRGLLHEKLRSHTYFIGETLEYADIISQLGTWRVLEAYLALSLEQAYQEACATTGETAGELLFAPPGWKMIATIYHRFGDAAATVLSNGVALAINIEGSNVSATAHLPELRELLAGYETAQSFGPKLTLSYLNTVYNEEGEETAFVQYELDAEYIRSLQDPLPGTRIKDGWYNARDRGARKHVGTDMRASEGTPIYSCTDGTVIHIGSNEGAGNYIVVLDPEGFEYHYYHLVRMVDFLREGQAVEKGDVVGYVGDTGNSAANHLHLSVISPAYTFINPYPMLRDMRKLQSNK